MQANPYSTANATYVRATTANDVQFSTSYAPGCMEQAIIYTPNGAGLWVVHLPRNHVTHVDLTANKTHTYALEHALAPISYSCVPNLAQSGNWLAACTEPHFPQPGQSLSVIDLASGKKIHELNNLGHMRQLMNHGDYLHILHSGFVQDEPAKLLRCDSKDWEAAPAEIRLPADRISHFHKAGDNFLFVACNFEGDQKRFCLLATSEEAMTAAFEQRIEPDWKRSADLGTSPLLTCFDDEFYVCLPDELSGQTHLSKLAIAEEEATISAKPVCTVNTEFTDIQDFHLLDSNLVLLLTKKPNDSSFAIRCINLANDTQEVFDLPMSSAFGTSFRPQFVRATAKRAHLLFSTSLDCAHKSRCCFIATAVITADLDGQPFELNGDLGKA